MIITPTELREDWLDNPNVSDYDLHALNGVGDGEIENAIDTVVRRRQEEYWALYDEIRGEATRLLLDRRTT